MEDSKITEAKQLAGLVAYQKDAIVSNGEIVNEETGTLTIFAFDRGQVLSEHTAPFDALSMCRKAAPDHHRRHPHLLGKAI